MRGVHLAVESASRSRRDGWKSVAFRRAFDRSEERRGDRDLPLLSLASAGYLYPREGDSDRQRASQENLPRYLCVEPGDLVVNPMWLTGGALAVSDKSGVVSPDYRVFRPRPETDPRFAHHLLRSTPFLDQYRLYARAETTFDRRIQQDDLAGMPLILPPVEEQRRIADFLDEQVTRIDKAVRARTRQRVLLDEEHGAARDRLVLGADEPGPRVRADWTPFNLVPTSWRQTRLRSVPCTVQTGPFGSQLHSDEYVEEGWPVVNPASLKESRIVAVPGMAVDDAVRERLSRHQLRAGDVVFGRRGDLGRAGLVTNREEGWLLGTGSLMVRLPSRDPLFGGYLMRLLETAPLRHYFESQSVGSTMANLNISILSAMPLVLPPAMRQEQIVEEFAELDEAWRSATSDLDRSTRLMEELKQSLITAAVTGEFEVASASGRGVPS